MLVVICCMAGIAAADEKNILVTSGSDRATPIAVVPFGWQGGSVLPDDMAQIVSDDLRNSGYYAPIPKGNMISQPTQASEVIFRDWKAVGAQYLMVGSITPAGGRLQIQPLGQVLKRGISPEILAESAPRREVGVLRRVAGPARTRE